MKMNSQKRLIEFCVASLCLAVNLLNAQGGNLPFPKVHGKSFTVECKCMNPEKKKNHVGPFKAYWATDVGNEVIRKNGYDYIGFTMAFDDNTPELINLPEAFIRIDSLDRVHSIMNYDSMPLQKVNIPTARWIYGNIYEERLFIDYQPFYPYYFYNLFDFDSYFFILRDVSFDSILSEEVYIFETVESNIWRELHAGHEYLRSKQFTVSKNYGIIQLILQRRKSELKFECNAPFWKKSGE